MSVPVATGGRSAISEAVAGSLGPVTSQESHTAVLQGASIFTAVSSSTKDPTGNAAQTASAAGHLQRSSGSLLLLTQKPGRSNSHSLWPSVPLSCLLGAALAEVVMA